MFFLIITMIFNRSLRADNIIFDLGGVLIDTDSAACLQHIGLKNMVVSMAYLCKGPRAINTHIKKKFFEILEEVAVVHEFKTDGDCYAYDEHGTPLPYFMCMWLNGGMTCQEIRNCILTAIQDNPQWFACQAEKRMIVNLISMVFTPEKFVATRKLYSKGVSFVKACKKKGHKVYVLSNWDTESFALLAKKYPALFELFDGIVISGQVKKLKPFAGIYTGLIDTYQLDNKKCWFVDDQKENIAAAAQLGINTVLCGHYWPIKSPNFFLVAQAMKKKTLPLLARQISDTTRKA